MQGGEEEERKEGRGGEERMRKEREGIFEGSGGNPCVSLDFP